VNAGMVTKSTFSDFSLVHRDGCYYLRSDRILGIFLFDPYSPLPLLNHAKQRRRSSSDPQPSVSEVNE
jgi:hypothetical protein